MLPGWYVPALGVILAVGFFVTPVLRRYYFYHLVPESQSLPKWQRAQLYGQVSRSAGAFLSMLGSVISLPLILGLTFLRNAPLGWLVAAVFLVVLIDLPIWVMFRARVREAALKQMVELGQPVCIHCGYDLRAVTSPICPECGKVCEPGVFKGPAQVAGQVDTPSVERSEQVDA